MPSDIILLMNGGQPTRYRIITIEKHNGYVYECWVKEEKANFFVTKNNLKMVACGIESWSEPSTIGLILDCITSMLF